MHLEWAKKKSKQANALLNRAHQRESNAVLIVKAIEIYQEVIQSGVELADPYLGIAWLAFSAGQHDQAMSLLLTAQEIEPSNLDVMRMQQRFENMKSTLQPDIPPPHETEVSSLRSHLPPPLDSKKDAASPSNETAIASDQTIITPESAIPEPLPTQISKILGPPKSGMTSQGTQVGLLQNWLQKLGHKQVKLTHLFDQATLNAVQAFQMKRKLKISGLVDKQTAKHLNHLSQKWLDQAEQPETKPSVQSNQTQLVRDLGSDAKKYCHQGPQVLILQQTLQALDYQVSLNSLFDQATTKAVRSFQSKHKLPLNGVIDQKCRQILNQEISIQKAIQSLKTEILQSLESYAKDQKIEISTQSNEHIQAFLRRLSQPDSQTSSGRPKTYTEAQPTEVINEITELLGTPGQVGVTSQGQSVLRCQEILIDKGYELKANSQFDLQTFTQLKRYQADHQLEANGYVDEPTRDLLNENLKRQIARQTLLLKLESKLDPFTQTLGQQRNNLQTAEQILKLAEGLDFAQVLKSALHIQKISADLGPPGRANLIQSGPEVELLQIWLQSESEFEISGDYDPATFKAVRQFQLKHKIAMTGTVDAKTRQILNHNYQKNSS